MKISECADSQSLQEDTVSEELEGGSFLADHSTQEMHTVHPPASQQLYETNSSVEGLLSHDHTHNDEFHATGAVEKPAKDQQILPCDPHKEIEHSLSSLPLRQISSPQTLQNYRKNDLSTNTIPRQPVVKVVASRPPALNHLNLPLAASLTGHMDNIANGIREEKDQDHETSYLSAGLSMGQLQSDEKENQPMRPSLRPLQSPCYFHRRFDDAVNIQKVLEEIEWFSHSQLMQTATSVRDVSKQLQRRPIKCAVRNVMIVTKARDNSLVCLTRELTEWLLTTPRYGSDLGVNVYVDAKLQDSKRFDATGLIAKDPRVTDMLKYWTPNLCWTSPEKFDLVLTLGGDGTVLFTSWLFQRIVPPILSFSLGSLGFLTNFEFTGYKEHLNTVMGDGGMRVNLRMRFTCTVFRANQSQGAAPSDMEQGKRVEVLNELVIDRGPSPFVSNLEVYGDDELLTVVQADGCIFSTPTGMSSLYWRLFFCNEHTVCVPLS
jgi:NAD+ kinase